MADEAKDINKDAPLLSKCICAAPRLFKKELSRPITGLTYCDHCGAGAYDHYWRCQRVCGLKFCTTCIGHLDIKKTEIQD